MTREKSLHLNTVTALIMQLVSFVCGFILPRYILLYYGSEINGLIASITQFLGVISFIEMGIGPVIQSNLYKPLAKKDFDQVSRIVASAQKFYRKIACIFLAYIGVLLFVYPTINREFDALYTASLLLIISLSTFAQYYFGITYQVFLNADQKLYIGHWAQIISTLLNTLICLLLMYLGMSVHLVKLFSSAIFVVRPLVLNLYVKKHYSLNLKIKYDHEPIRQKWNGFAQHLAAILNEETDVILLTFFDTYKSVSVYSVYFLVVNGVSKIIMTLVTGLESFWGNMLANDEKDSLLSSFDKLECIIHAGSAFLFGSAAVLIAPFVMVYIRGTGDAAAYYQPLFGAILTFAYGVQCLRIPYFRIIKAAGHYKQTQNGSFITAAINVLGSLIFVVKFGLIGVSVGTFLAMAFHTVYLAFYLRKNIINWPFGRFLRHCAVDLICIVLTFLLTKSFTMGSYSYLSWIIYALKVSLVSLPLCLGLNFLVYRKQFMGLLSKAGN